MAQHAVHPVKLCGERWAKLERKERSKPEKKEYMKKDIRADVAINKEPLSP
jgi:hypothetical protein